jgi:hypothetical protein
MKPATNSKSTISLMMTFLLSLLLLPAAQLDLHAQAPAPAYVELDAVQLDQLVAPIALDPDSLVAQMIDQDAAHQLCGDPKKVCPALPVDRPLFDQL